MATTTFGSRTRKLSPRQLSNLVALAAVVVVNALANILPLGGVTTGEVSDRYPSLFTPAGYVFSIWGLIYLLLGVFAVYQALPAQRDNPRLVRLGYLFVISCAFNVAWLFAWHYGQIALTMLLMLGLLVSLILLYERLEIGKTKVSRREALAVRLPFSVYLGWITVATIANVSVLLIDLGYTGGWLAPLWALVAIAAATAIGLLVLGRRGDVPFVLVLVWAFIGIATKQWGAEVLVVLGALLTAGVLLWGIMQHARRARLG